MIAFLSSHCILFLLLCRYFCNRWTSAATSCAPLSFHRQSVCHTCDTWTWLATALRQSAHFPRCSRWPLSIFATTGPFDTTIYHRSYLLVHVNVTDISCTVLIHCRLEDADSIIEALQHNALLCNLILDNNPCAMHSPRIHAALCTMAEAPAANPASAAESLTKRLAFVPSSAVAAGRSQDALGVLRLMLLRQQAEIQQHRHEFLTGIAVRIHSQNVTFGSPSQYGPPFSACISDVGNTVRSISAHGRLRVCVSGLKQGQRLSSS